VNPITIDELDSAIAAQLAAVKAAEIADQFEVSESHNDSNNSLLKLQELIYFC